MPNGTGIIVKHEDKFLVVQRTDNGQWTSPGGGIEDYERPDDAAVRELLEESGIAVTREDLIPIELIVNTERKV